MKITENKNNENKNITPSNKIFCHHKLWPCYWSTMLATPHNGFELVSFNTIAIFNGSSGMGSSIYAILGMFGVGAFAMRTAGCIINDLWDRDIDRLVIRTKFIRPIATGEVTVTNALRFLTLNLAIGAGTLVALPNNVTCILWGLPSIVLVVLYPTMKRYFIYPQLVLGLTMNWGCFMGYATIYGPEFSITSDVFVHTVLPLYCSGITWTLIYDTIYGHQDKNDDKKLQLHSTALSFGSNETTQRNILNGLATVTYMNWMIVGYNCSSGTIVGSSLGELSLLPYTIGTSMAYAHLLWQINTVDFNDPKSCMDRFISNNAVGAIMFTTIACSKMFV
jgi:4-hydroxybenzoate polyprenyltransferase